MLCLTRKRRETILIGDPPQIAVHVVRIKGGYVRLAIDAPKDVKILRGELVRKDKGAA